MLLGNESIISEGIGTFPDGVEIRSDTVSGNILIFDYKNYFYHTKGKAINTNSRSIWFIICQII